MSDLLSNLHTLSIGPLSLLLYDAGVYRYDCSWIHLFTRQVELEFAGHLKPISAIAIKQQVQVSIWICFNAKHKLADCKRNNKSLLASPGRSSSFNQASGYSSNSIYSCEWVCLARDDNIVGLRDQCKLAGEIEATGEATIKTIILNAIQSGKRSSCVICELNLFVCLFLCLYVRLFAGLNVQAKKKRLRTRTHTLACDLLASIAFSG